MADRILERGWTLLCKATSLWVWMLVTIRTKWIMLEWNKWNKHWDGKNTVAYDDIQTEFTAWRFKHIYIFADLLIKFTAVIIAWEQSKCLSENAVTEIWCLHFLRWHPFFHGISHTYFEIYILSLNLNIYYLNNSRKKYLLIDLVLRPVYPYIIIYNRVPKCASATLLRIFLRFVIATCTLINASKSHVQSNYEFMFSKPVQCER